MTNEYANYSIRDWMGVVRANDTDIYTMRPRAEVEAEEERQRQVDLIFPAVNANHLRAVKLYDAETGKATSALIEDAEPTSKPYIRGVLAGVIIGMCCMIIANILAIMVL